MRNAISVRSLELQTHLYPAIGKKIQKIIIQFCMVKTTRLITVMSCIIYLWQERSIHPHGSPLTNSLCQTWLNRGLW